MGREIKFRGRFFTGKWIHGDLIHLSTGYGIRERAGLTLSFSRVDEDTIGQYTGLKDSNNKEIYEGDILRLAIPDGSTRHFVVEWATEDRKLMPLSGFEHDGNDIDSRCWCFNWEGHRLYPSVIDGVSDNEMMEIVGNIHDNPEMLKGGEE